jgi:4-alpha-glucanotransferase
MQNENFRMNRPGIGTGQWGYRMPNDCLTDKLAAKIKTLVEKSGRA